LSIACKIPLCSNAPSIIPKYNEGFFIVYHGLIIIKYLFLYIRRPNLVQLSVL
jgi:hypothetical protein